MLNTGVRERAVDGPRDGDQASVMPYHHANDRKQATLIMVLTGVASVVLIAMLLAAILSTRACSV
jgi:hypothetical protein